MRSILDVKGLTLNIDNKKILNDINISLWEGHVHAIVGQNGAGKSTFASTIMGLEGYRNIEGEIFFQGVKINDLSVSERGKLGITMAWQEPARFEGVKIRDFIRAGAKNKSEKHIKEAMKISGLNPLFYYGRNVDKTLSGGERKKVELASIIAMEPKLAFLDEPDSGIDVESLRRIFDSVKYLKEKGTTVVLITHSMEVLKQAEHAFLLCGGKVLDKGSIEHISKYIQDNCNECDHRNVPDPKEVDNDE